GVVCVRRNAGGQVNYGPDIRHERLDAELSSILKRHRVRGSLEACVQDSGAGTVRVPAEKVNFLLMADITAGPSPSYGRGPIAHARDVLDPDRVDLWAA